MDKQSLNKKKVVILGASSGIGLATAQRAAAEGATVIIVSSHQQRIHDALQTLPPACEGYAVDLSNEEAVKKFFITMGHLDHLVYTAGENLQLGMIHELETEQARQFFTIRYWGAFMAVKYAAPNLNPGGSITLTGGIASTRPGKGWSVASSLCCAMEGFTRALAVELAPVRVNCVVPGVVKTNVWNSLSETDRENLYTSVGHALLVKRVGEADEIAQSYLYLMKQTYGTGQTIVVDGGGVLI